MVNQDDKLHLLLRCGDDEFAIACSDVVEVIPMIHLASPDKASPRIAGNMDYHGSEVAVADFSEWITGTPCTRLLSTRIILLQSTTDENCRVGIIAELATRTLWVPESAFSHYDTAPPHNYSKIKIEFDGRRIQLIDTEAVFETINRAAE